MRVETCSYADGMMREATEIQNVQIADGPVPQQQRHCHDRGPLAIRTYVRLTSRVGGVRVADSDPHGLPAALHVPNRQRANFQGCRHPTTLGTIPPRYSPKRAEPLPQVEFEVNLVFLFTDGHLLTENFPVKLVRM